MASKAEDAKLILDAFHKAYFAFEEAKKVVGDLYTASKKAEPDKRNTLLAMIAQYKMAEAVLEELHHSIGHSMFDDCWTETPVGEESTTGGILKQLFDGLRELLGDEVEVQGIDIDQPLPPDTPRAVREKIEEIRKSRAMAAKAHLH